MVARLVLYDLETEAQIKKQGAELKVAQIKVVFLNFIWTDRDGWDQE